VDETDPYGVAPVVANHAWDYVQYNSLTTTSGLRFELDDNLSLRHSVGNIFGQNFRRIGLEIPGDVKLEYLDASGSFGLGRRVVGQTSGASGLIIEDTANTLTVMLPKGKFRDTERIVDEDGAEANLVSVTVTDGVFLRMREDKLQEEKQISAGGGFKSVFELGTKDQRVMRFDDQDQTIRIDTPESLDSADQGGHYVEINSDLDFIRAETEFGHYLVMDDPNKFVELTTPGTDVDDKGYRIRLDEANKRVLIKGDEKEYFFELDEAGDRIRMASPYPSGRSASVEITNFYAGGGQNDNVQIFANADQGSGRNGVMWDRGHSASGRSQQIYMYNDSRTSPSSWVRLVSDQMGSGDPPGLVEAGERTVLNRLRIEPTVGAFLFGTPDASIIASGLVKIEGSNFSRDTVEIKGFWTSKYFRHQHQLRISQSSGSNLNRWGIFIPANALGIPHSSGNFAVTEFPFGAGTGIADSEPPTFGI
jgi:hypothetical protein